MRHRKRGRKLGRTSAHRKALLRNLTIALFTHGRIVTTLAKAKETRPYAEKLITLARKGMTAREGGEHERYLHCYRRAISELGDKQIAKKLFDEIAPGYANRPGGYTRILRDAHNRLGDNAPRAIFELVEFDGGGGGEAADRKRRKKPGKRARAQAK